MHLLDTFLPCGLGYEESQSRHAGPEVEVGADLREFPPWILDHLPLVSCVKEKSTSFLLGHSIFGVSLYFSLTFKILTSILTITSFQVFFGQIISLQNTGCGNNTIYQKISATIILS